MRKFVAAIMFASLMIWEVGAEPVLRGIFRSSVGEAVVVEDGGRQTLLWRGQVKNGMRLIEAGDGWARLFVDGKEIKLTLQYRIEETHRKEKESQKIEVIKVDPELILAGHKTMEKFIAVEKMVGGGFVGEKVREYLDKVPPDALINRANEVLQTLKVQVVRDEAGECQGIGIADMTPGSPAEGLKLASGDIIKSVNGRPIRTLGDLIMVYNEYKKGLRRFVVEIERGGQIIRKEYRLE